jgi:hypothetical protein
MITPINSSVSTSGSMSLETPDGDSILDDADDSMRVTVVNGGGGSGGTAQADRTSFVDGTAC